MNDDMKKVIIRVIISFIILLLAIFVPSIATLKLTLFLISYLIIGFDVIKEALKNIIHGEVFDENFLMLIATIGAFATGEYPEAVVVMLLYQIGECFQDYAVDKSRDSISKLMDIKPEYANIEVDGKLVEVNPEDIKINETIIVKAGEKIPLDGVIIEGSTMLDTSSLTGESVPQNATIGSTVYSGSINKTNMIKINVTKTYEDSTVNKILELIENAEDKKAKSENFITKFAKYYTPIVVVCALVLAFIPPLFVKNADLFDYIHRACSFLVISCPCALVISIPLGFFAGLGGASKNGILIKGSNYIEILSKVKTIVLDKTGTLTTGTFGVTKVQSEKITSDKLLELAAYAENYSEHPIALSIKKAYQKQIDGNLVSNSKEIAGNGIEVIVNNKKIDIGNKKLMNSIGLEIEEPDEFGTIVYLATNNEYMGYIVISDKLKNESKSAIKELNSNEINTIMLTGDNNIIANQVATELEIKEFYSELLPHEKVEKLETILSKYKVKGNVAFIGDGINDAPVLIRADIGIAMGALGSDAAIEAADIVIMDDNISKINTAIRLAKKTMKIVKTNIYFSIIIKLLVLILSAFGIATMWEAVFADVGVSFLAILNSMRALNIKNNNSYI